MTNDWKADKSLNWLDTWRAMEKLHREQPGKIRAIGLPSQLTS
jgi:glycerol 2-dehydrogenase (NADP+)